MFFAWEADLDATKPVKHQADPVAEGRAARKKEPDSKYSVSNLVRKLKIPQT
jgi:hypothetical protein